MLFTWKKETSYQVIGTERKSMWEDSGRSGTKVQPEIGRTPVSHYCSPLCWQWIHGVLRPLRSFFHPSKQWSFWMHLLWLSSWIHDVCVYVLHMCGRLSRTFFLHKSKWHDIRHIIIWFNCNRNFFFFLHYSKYTVSYFCSNVLN